MKIKICSPQLGLSPVSYLGGEVYDYQTIKGFTKRGIKVYIYLPKNRYYDHNLKNLVVAYAPITHIIPPWVYSIICLPYLFNLYRREKFDILRIHSPRFLGPAGIIFKLFHPKVPLLCSAVTVDDSFLYFPLEKVIYKLSDRIIVQSNYMKSRLIKRYKINADKIAITYGGKIEGVKLWRKKPPEAAQIGEKEPVMLFMGSLTKRKNPLFLVSVFKNVRSKIKNLKLVIVGEGDLKEAMKKRLRDEDLLENCLFISSAYGEEKVYWFSRMNVFVLPSLDEGFGLVVTEAMSFGKPIITSINAAFKEIIDSGKDGYTMDLTKPGEWENIIIRLLKNPLLAKKVGANARDKVNKVFNWERTYDLNKKVIEQML